jgi:deoxyhypusine monooxygenase
MKLVTYFNKAYVFGQMQNEASVPYLKSVISNVQESPMVRHECCEALGSIASPECLEILLQFSKDECTVVAESCQVGLDMLEYETSEQFKLL